MFTDKRRYRNISNISENPEIAIRTKFRQSLVRFINYFQALCTRRNQNAGKEHRVTRIKYLVPKRSCFSVRVGLGFPPTADYAKVTTFKISDTTKKRNRRKTVEMGRRSLETDLIPLQGTPRHKVSTYPISITFTY